MDGPAAVPVGAAAARARPEVIVHLPAAAEPTGVSRFVAQGYADGNGIRAGGRVKTGEDPLDRYEGTAAYTSRDAPRRVEDLAVKAGGTVLRPGALYGPGATGDQVELVRERRFPLAECVAGKADANPRTVRSVRFVALMG